MKVEDAAKGRTKPTRTDRWTHEIHEFDIDKANEIELTVYDKSGDHPLPIGMLWLRISDIAEEMRRKKIESEFNNSGWVSAEKMGDGGSGGSSPYFYPPRNQSSGGARPTSGQGANTQGPVPQTGPIFIDAWFSLEPVGRIQLTISFGKSSVLRLKHEAANCSSKTKQGPQAVRSRACPKGRCPSAQRRSPRAVRP